MVGYIPHEQDFVYLMGILAQKELEFGDPSDFWKALLILDKGYKSNRSSRFSVPNKIWKQAKDEIYKRGAPGPATMIYVDTCGGIADIITEVHVNTNKMIRG